MPLIRQGLAKRSGRQPDNRVCPDEAVARGAALYAARIRQGLAGPPPLRVSSVSTHSLGIEGTDQNTGERVNKVLIPKGTPLPAAAKREFMGKSLSGQVMAFNVLEGEHPHPSGVTIGRVILKDLPDVADQWPVSEIWYSAAGRLVDARVRYTDRHAERYGRGRSTGPRRAVEEVVTRSQSRCHSRVALGTSCRCTAATGPGRLGTAAAAAEEIPAGTVRSSGVRCRSCSAADWNPKRLPRLTQISTVAS
jgi:hypothetical protein